MRLEPATTEHDVITSTLYWKQDPNSNRKTKLICFYCKLTTPGSLFEFPKHDVFGFEIILADNTNNSSEISGVISLLCSQSFSEISGVISLLCDNMLPGKHNAIDSSSTVLLSRTTMIHGFDVTAQPHNQ